MIQKTTQLQIIDNSGVFKVFCIALPKGYQRRYADLGDVILVSLRKLKQDIRKKKILLKKGAIHKALIVRTKFRNYRHNAAILLHPPRKFIGTRIFGSLSKKFRKSRYKRIVSMCSGVHNLMTY